MLGTIVNFFTIFVGGIIGVLLKGGLPKRFTDTIMSGVALCVIYIGISGTLKGENMLLIVISIAIGSLLGEFINIDEKLILLGNFIENKAKNFSKDTSISLGFVTASLLFCVGAMAVVGSLESGLLGKYDILFTKSILDGVTALILSSTLGIGVILSAFSVLVYQGLITLAASLLQNILTTPIVNEMSAVGSLLIIGIGLNMLGITKIKVANMLPAIFIPVIYGLFF
ncbi:putative membrane protein YdfK [compost metagenome]